MPVFNVVGMSCQHCVKAVTKAVQSVDNTAVVEVDLNAKQVKVESLAAPERLASAIAEEGYQVLGIAS